MKRAAIFPLFIAVSLFAGAGARAQSSTPATAAAPQQNALAPLEFLIGTWEHGLGQRTFRRTLGGKFIEMKAVNRGGDVRLDAWWLIGADPTTGKLTLWEFAEGKMDTFTQAAGFAVGEIRFEGRWREGARSGPLRLTFKKDAGGFSLVLEQQRGGKWEELSLDYTPLPATAELYQPTNSDLPATKSPLAPLGKFTGTWLIEGESEGRKVTVEYAFLWTLGGRFMTTTYSIAMGGPPELHAMSIIGYNPQTKEIVQRGFNAEGSVLRAKVSVTGDTLTWEGQMAGARTQTLRSTYRLVDADTLEFTTEIKKGAAWESMGAAPMRRKKP